MNVVVLILAIAAPAAEPADPFPSSTCAGLSAAGGAAVGGALSLYGAAVVVPSGFLSENNIDGWSFWGALVAAPPMLGAVGGAVGGGLCSSHAIEGGLGALGGSVAGAVLGVLPSIATLLLTGISDVASIAQGLAILFVPIGYTLGATLGAGFGAWGAIELSENSE